MTKQPTKSKRLSNAEKDHIKQVFVKASRRVYENPARETLDIAALGRELYDAALAPYRAAMDALPSQMFSKRRDFVFEYQRDVAETALSIHVRFEDAMPWFATMFSTDMFTLPGYTTDRIRFTQSFAERHPDLIDKLVSMAVEIQNKEQSARNIRATGYEIVNTCSTSGQLLTILPQIREFLPAHLRDHTATTRGVAAVKTRLANRFLALEYDQARLVALLAAYKIMGPI